MSAECLFTRLVRERKEEIKKILGSDSDIVEKVVMLRRFAREANRAIKNVFFRKRKQSRPAIKGRIMGHTIHVGESRDITLLSPLRHLA